MVSKRFDFHIMYMFPNTCRTTTNRPYGLQVCIGPKGRPCFRNWAEMMHLLTRSSSLRRGSPRAAPRFTLFTSFYKYTTMWLGIRVQFPLWEHINGLVEELVHVSCDGSLVNFIPRC